MRAYRTRFKDLSPSEVLTLAEELYRTNISEPVHVANYILTIRPDAFNTKNIIVLDRYLNHLDSWGEIDDFCVHVLPPLLHTYPTQTLSLLARWNKSKNLWKRRASVVAFTRSIGQSGAFVDEALKLCDNLIHDEEDLVLKGVGWALKDNLEAHKTKVMAYIARLRKRGTPATVTLYALRNVTGKERACILSI